MRKLLARLWRYLQRHIAPAVPLPGSPAVPLPTEHTGVRNAINIHEILDTLPNYFRDLQALRTVDDDAYAIFARLGGTMAVSGSMFATRIDQKWIDEPPMLRCLFMPKREDADTDTCPLVVGYMLRFAGGQVCVNRAGLIVALPKGGICYRVVTVHDLEGRPFPSAFFVHIADDGALRVLPERRKAIQILPNKGHIRKRTTSIPAFVVEEAARKKLTTEQWATQLASIILSAERPDNAILVRASQRDLTAAWTIDRRDAKRFFAKRETGSAADGKRKRVLHYVADFSRRVNGVEQDVRAHYRGERAFDWQGYKIEVSGLGFHHSDAFNADIPAYEEGQTNRAGVSMERFARMIRSRYRRPVFLKTA